MKGTFTQAGQYQVIIGNDVNVFFNEFTAYAGIEGTSKEAAKQAAKQNQSVVQRAVSNMAEIFAPLIPALITGGLILGFRNVIGQAYPIESDPESVATFWVGLYSFLWLIAEAIFHFLPVGIVWSITKKMGTTQMLGIILGITLVSPQLLNAYAVADAVAEGTVPFWDFGFIQIDMIGYQGQVIPAILAGFTLVYLERFFKKISPNSISMIVVPFMSLTLAVIVAHGILGPIGWTIGMVLSDVIYAGLTSAMGWLFATFFGFLYAPLVITGLHHMTNAIDIQLTAIYDGTILWPMIALSNIAQGSAVLGMIVLQKDDEEARQVSVPAMISCYLGVTEPALFGVNLKLIYPLVCGMIGSAIAATISVGSGVMAYSIGVGGLPGIISIQSQHVGTFALCMLVAIVVPFVLTYLVGKRRMAAEQGETVVVEGEKENAAAVLEAIKPVLYATQNGKAVPLTEVPDKVFAEKIMGDGFAIIPTDNKVVSPVAGEIVTVAETAHAYGIRTADGLELIVHVGLETVALNGEGFDVKVKQGQQVHPGDVLTEVDLDFIQSKGCEIYTPVVIVNSDECKALEFSYGEVKAGESIVVTYTK